MELGLRQALLKCETDLDGALRRFSEDEDLYCHCLQTFLRDSTMSELDEALKTKSWDAAFTAAHALKGLAGNMGFIPLFHAAAELVVLIRAGRTADIDAAYNTLKENYINITVAISDKCE